MTRRAGLALALASLAACTDSSVPPRAADHHAVIAAVLQAQPDVAAERRAYLREFPEEDGILSRLLDHRLCVEGKTAGRPEDFSSSTVNPPGPDGRNREVKWDRATRSFPIRAEARPPYLRRAWSLSICPAGTVRLSNPRFDGGTARIFIEKRCRGWCGSGGELILKKRRGRWEIEGWASRWMS